MKAKRPLLIALRLARPLVHLLLILGCFYVMILLRAHTDLIPGVQLRIPPLDMEETMMFATLSGILFLIIGASRSLYTLFRPVQGYYRKFLSVRGLWIIVSSFIAFMGFGYVFVNGISRFVLFIGALLFFLVGTLVDMLLNIIQAHLEQQQPYQILVLGSDDLLSTNIVSMLASYRIYEVTLQTNQDIQYITFDYDIVVVAGKIALPLLQDIADTARIQGQGCYHIGDELFLEDLIAQPQRLGPLMALEYSASPLDGRWRVVKRLVDVVGASVGLLLLFPVFLVIACLITGDSPGPVLYMQPRVGKGKQLFRFIKFRSMYTHLSVGKAYGGKQASKLYTDLIHSDQNIRDEVLPKIENDPRVTRVGYRLRKTSLDELPSLWSVLIGDMSLVGPRPHMPSEVNRYDRRQERLFSIKPGITGYAQIFGRDQLPFDEEARLDLYYIQNWSLFLDVYVLVSTVKVVFSGR